MEEIIYFLSDSERNQVIISVEKNKDINMVIPYLYHIHRKRGDPHADALSEAIKIAGSSSPPLRQVA